MARKAPEILKLSASRIHAEKNLDSYPIFIPAESRVRPHSRLLTRRVEGSDGTAINASVLVSYSPENGALTTEDEKLLYVLFDLSKEQGDPDVFKFTRRELARRLGRCVGGLQVQD